MTKETVFVTLGTYNLLVIYTIVLLYMHRDLTLVAEPIPEMKYRRRTGENSRRPGRVEHMGS